MVISNSCVTSTVVFRLSQTGKPITLVPRALQKDPEAVAPAQHHRGDRPRPGGQSDFGGHRLAAPVKSRDAFSHS